MKKIVIWGALFIPASLIGFGVRACMDLGERNDKWRELCFNAGGNVYADTTGHLVCAHPLPVESPK